MGDEPRKASWCRRQRSLRTPSRRKPGSRTTAPLTTRHTTSPLESCGRRGGRSPARRAWALPSPRPGRRTVRRGVARAVPGSGASASKGRSWGPRLRSPPARETVSRTPRPSTRTWCSPSGHARPTGPGPFRDRAERPGRLGAAGRDPAHVHLRNSRGCTSTTPMASGDSSTGLRRDHPSWVVVALLDPSSAAAGGLRPGGLSRRGSAAWIRRRHSHRTERTSTSAAVVTMCTGDVSAVEQGAALRTEQGAPTDTDGHTINHAPPAECPARIFMTVL